MAQIAAVTPDGWTTTDSRAFRVLADHAPPRPWGYWDQIRIDLREPKIVWLWARGLLFAVLGVGLGATAVVAEEWSLLLVGVLALYHGLRLLSLWFRLARATVESIRSHPVATGVVARFAPHPIIPAIVWVGRATRPSGDMVDVAAGLPLAHAIGRAGTPAEVWFLDAPDSQYQSVFAYRPLPAGA